MKKVFLSFVAVATFGVSLVASEQAPTSMYDALRNLPTAQNATDVELTQLKAYLEDLEVTFGGIINPGFEGVNTRNPEGFEVFKKIVGADRFVITLQPISADDSANVGIDDEDYEDEV